MMTIQIVSFGRRQAVADRTRSSFEVPGMKRSGVCVVAARCAPYCAVILWLSPPVHAAEPAFRETLRRYVDARSDETRSTEPPPGFASVVEHSIGLEYSVMLRKDGIDEPVDADHHRFHAGDQIRVRIQPLSELYIYVFFDDQGGCRRCLLPSDKNSPRLAKYDQPVELPSDGSVFEFEAAAEQETFTLIATQKPDEDLAGLCDLVCKKRSDRLSPEERTLQADLASKNQRAMTAIQDRQQKAVFYRGRLSPQSLSRAAADMKQRGADDVVVVEPPGEKQTSTLVMMFSTSTAAPKLVVSIALKATRAAAEKPRAPRG